MPADQFYSARTVSLLTSLSVRFFAPVPVRECATRQNRGLYPGTGFSVALSRSVSGPDSCISPLNCASTLIIVCVVGGIDTKGFQFVLESMLSLFGGFSNVMCVDSLANSARVRYILVAAIDMVISEGSWNICVAERHKSFSHITTKDVTW
jgi:hypothetical protein